MNDKPQVIDLCESPDLSLELGLGGAMNRTAMWWRHSLPVPGATWSLHLRETPMRSGPAVVNDFGDLVLVENDLS